MTSRLLQPIYIATLIRVRFLIALLFCSGPVEPTYPDICCDEVSSGLVCEGTTDNIVGFATDIPDMFSCQILCQV
jgi:hypothetical protein